MNLNALNVYLNKNPKLLSKYIDVSMAVIGAVLKPINKVMKHALVVQGIDPKIMPGERQRKALQAALDQDLNKFHEKDFDDDYDFSWARKCLGVTNAKLVDLHVTQETFNKLTDLTHVDDKHETRLHPTIEENKVKDTEESRPVHINDSSRAPFETPAFKEAIVKLKAFAAMLDNTDDEEEQMISQKEIDDAGKNFFEMQRAKRKAAHEEEEIAAVKYNIEKKLNIKPIETYRKGLFKRVDKKKE